MKKSLLLLALSLINLINVNGQRNKTNLYIEKIINKLDSNLTEEAIPLLDMALFFELKDKNPRNDTLLLLANTKAELLLELFEFQKAALIRDSLFIEYVKRNDIETSGDQLSKLYKIYDNVWYYDYKMDPPKTGDNKLLVNFGLQKILESDEENGIFKAEVDGGLNQFVSKSGKGLLVGVYDEEFENRNGFNGEVTIDTCFYNSSRVTIKVYNKEDKSKFPRVGDYVNLYISPPFKKLDLFSDLVINYSIKLKGLEDQLILHPYHLLYYQRKTLEEAVYNYMAMVVRATFETYKEYLTTDAAMVAPMKKGYYQGRSVGEVMRDCKGSDIKLFLYFVKEYPGKYSNKQFRINETFATWVLNEGLLNSNILLDTILSAKNKTQRIELYKKYDTQIRGGVLDTWLERANDSAYKQTKKAIESGNNIVDIVIEFNQYYKSDTALARAYFERGLLFYYSNQTDSAKKYYQKSIEIALKRDEYKELALAYRQLGIIEQGDKNYQKAIEQFSKSLEYRKALQMRSFDLGNWTSMGSLYWSIAYGNYKLGNYPEANMYYTLAGEYYDKGFAIYQNQGDLHEGFGSVLRKQGKYDSSNIQYNKAVELYRFNGDKERLADAIDELAYNYFETGEYRKAIEKRNEAKEIHMQLGDFGDAGYSMSSIGQSYWNLGMLDSAIFWHKLAIENRGKGKDTFGMAFSYLKIGELYKENGTPKDAISYYKKAAELYKQRNLKENEAEVYTKFGELYQSLENHGFAIEEFQKALGIYEDLKYKNDIANTYALLGFSYMRINHYLKAKEYIDKAYYLRLEMDDKEGCMYSLCDLASLAVNQEFDYNKAINYLDSALVIAKETKSEYTLAYCYIFNAGIYETKGNIKLSEIFVDSAYAVYNKLEYANGQINCQLRYGWNQLNKGNFAEGLKIFNEALQVSRNKKLYAKESECLSAIAQYQILTSNYNSSFQYLDSSEILAVKTSNKWNIAGVELLRGNTYNIIGNYKKAIDYYEIADSVYSDINSEYSRGICNNNIGTIYFFQGDYINALRYFKKAMDIYTKNKIEGEVLISTTMNIGEVYSEDGLLEQADIWLNEAMALSIKQENYRGQASVGYLLGKLKHKRGQFEEAERDIKQALSAYEKMGDRQAVVEISGYLGKMYFEKGNTEQALKALNQSVQMAKEIGSVKYSWEPLYILSLIEKDKEKSLAYLKESVNALEQIKNNLVGDQKAKKKFAKAGDKAKIYAALVDKLIEQNDIAGAFYYQEMANITSLNDQSRGDGPSRGGKLIDGEEEIVSLELQKEGIYYQLTLEKSKPKEQQNQEKIKTLEKMMSVAQEEYESFVSNIKENDNDKKFAESIMESINPDDLDRKRNRIPNGISLLEYVMLKDKVIIFIANNETLNAKVIEISEENIKKFIDAYYFQITNKSDIKIVNESGQKLYDLLIGPVEELIKNSDKLAIVPTGIFFKLPFQALCKKEGSVYKYFGQEKELYYINDLTYLTDAEQRLTSYKILAFGNADKSLPNAEVEVKSIQNLFKGTKVYVQTAATEKVAKDSMGVYEIVHFATHGVLDPVSFKTSYLTMAPFMEEDGKFTMEEIGKMSLHGVNLVTLSACNTAVNENNAKGWINNPAKQFLKKGAKSVLASLWMVDDEATSKLMLYFYEYLKEGKIRSEALKLAQKKLLEEPKFSHPYYWSAFELIGEWR